jgi:hypothetical protein
MNSEHNLKEERKKEKEVCPNFVALNRLLQVSDRGIKSAWICNEFGELVQH